MLRSLTLLVVMACSVWGQSATVRRAPSSPFDLAQLIDSGSRIDWAPIWKDIGAPGTPPDDLPLPHCGDPDYSPCSVEIIGAQNPSQFILLVQQDEVQGDFFLRFLRQDDGWKFAGFYIAPLKYYPSRHAIIRFGDKTFLKVSSQGISGTGVASKIEDWFDLTLADFYPVFSFMPQGHNFWIPADVGRDIQGFARPDRGTDVETINLTLLIRFSLEGSDLGRVEFTGIYERPRGQSKFALRRAGIGSIGSWVQMPIEIKDFESLTDLEISSDDMLLAYNMPGLREVARGKEMELKRKLRELLDRCKHTPQKNEIMKLLGDAK